MPPTRYYQLLSLSLRLPLVFNENPTPLLSHSERTNKYVNPCPRKYPTIHDSLAHNPLGRETYQPTVDNKTPLTSSAHTPTTNNGAANP